MERLLRLADERICLGQWAAERIQDIGKNRKKAAMQMSQAAAMLRDPEAIEEMLEEICAEREQWQDRKGCANGHCASWMDRRSSMVSVL